MQLDEVRRTCNLHHKHPSGSVGLRLDIQGWKLNGTWRVGEGNGELGLDLVSVSRIHGIRSYVDPDA